MGGILEPTGEMGPFSTEVRRESFYWNRSGEGGRRLDRYSAQMPAEDVPAFLAALDQVTSQGRWTDWQDAGAREPLEGTSWVLPPDEEGEAPYPDWVVTRQDASIVIRGPWIVGPGDGAMPGENLVYGEIAYSDVEALRRALAASGELGVG